MIMPVDEMETDARGAEANASATVAEASTVETDAAKARRGTRALHPLLRRRWSPSAFRARAVEPEKLRSLLEAARWAPSSYNEQPWAFLVATRDDGTEHARMVECLVPGNREWAREAPVLLMTVAKRRYALDGRPNAHARHDVGLAAAQLVTQATAMGLSAHQMGGFDANRARETYGIPEGWEPVTVIAVGYAAPDAAPGERSRKPLEELAFAGEWGRPAAVAAEAATGG